MLNNYLARISTPSLLLLAPLILAVAGLFFYWREQKNPRHYPPGPKPQLLSGNLNDVPNYKPWRTYADWSKLYGPLVHFRIYNMHFVVVNSRELAHAMFERRSRIYSDRPYVPMLDLLGWFHVNAGFMRYGDEWRRHRRLFQEGFRRESARDYLGLQADKVGEFVTNLRKDPEQFMGHIRTLSAAVIMGSLYGHDVSSMSDPFVSLAENAAATLAHAQSPVATLVNLFPFLRHLPLSLPVFAFQRLANQSHKFLDEMLNVPYSFVKENMKSETAKPSILAKFLEKHAGNAEDPEQEHVFKCVSASAYIAGSDTTVSVLGTFFLAMSLYPEVQRKARKEVDAIIGKNTTPNIEDRPRLPYLEAVFRETLRWSPVAPVGVFKAASADDVVEGYVIPKGTTIIGNIWAMTRDETMYPDPESFKPERFLNDDGTCNEDDVSIAFGFGRRICPGRHMASATLWMAMTSVLSSFEIGEGKDLSGNEIDIDAVFSDGIISYCQPFKAPITQRT
ncbi:hypothetical protein AAF712_002388 [Marasmius tenuissimus]|uniref:Cytochrome P450 n=1 Tax=Marasmius tenuissimus TaxID=585030 RepID=A0ABR3AB36_9AGAR|nr:hypothetical protein PM082_020514 [Marasmius tenuissimus]